VLLEATILRSLTGFDYQKEVGVFVFLLPHHQSDSGATEPLRQEVL